MKSISDRTDLVPEIGVGMPGKFGVSDYSKNPGEGKGYLYVQ
jgi:hypothetical protein